MICVGLLLMVILVIVDNGINLLFLLVMCKFLIIFKLFLKFFVNCIWIGIWWFVRLNLVKLVLLFFKVVIEVVWVIVCIEIFKFFVFVGNGLIKIFGFIKLVLEVIFINFGIFCICFFKVFDVFCKVIVFLFFRVKFKFLLIFFWFMLRKWICVFGIFWSKGCICCLNFFWEMFCFCLGNIVMYNLFVFIILLLFLLFIVVKVLVISGFFWNSCIVCCVICLVFVSVELGGNFREMIFIFWFLVFINFFGSNGSNCKLLIKKIRVIIKVRILWCNV